MVFPTGDGIGGIGGRTVILGTMIGRRKKMGTRRRMSENGSYCVEYSLMMNVSC